MDYDPPRQVDLIATRLRDVTAGLETFCCADLHACDGFAEAKLRWRFEAISHLPSFFCESVF